MIRDVSRRRGHNKIGMKRKITYGLLTILIVSGLYFVLRFAFGFFTPYNKLESIDTSEEKEVCTEATQFRGLKLGKNGQIYNSNKYSDRYFEFTNENDSNFLNFSFNLYTIFEQIK